MDKKLRNIYTAFPEGKHKVLTLSYDDGKIPDKRLVALFNEYGLKGTFNLNGGLENAPFTELEYFPKDPANQKELIEELQKLLKKKSLFFNIYNRKKYGKEGWWIKRP